MAGSRVIPYDGECVPRLWTLHCLPWGAPQQSDGDAVPLPVRLCWDTAGMPGTLFTSLEEQDHLLVSVSTTQAVTLGMQEHDAPYPGVCFSVSALRESLWARMLDWSSNKE